MIKLDTAQYNYPGAIVSISEPHKSIHHNYFGVKDIAQGRAFTAETLFFIGEITQSFTSVAVLSLVEHGQLDLDMPLEIVATRNQRDNGRLRLLVQHYPFLKPMTVRELLSHTSGLPAYDKTETYAKIFINKPKKVWQIEAYLDLIMGNNIRFQPGYEWPVRGLYSESMTNYIIVGLVIEAVSGKKSSQQLKELFAQVGLSNTYYFPHGRFDNALLPNMMHCYLPIVHPFAEAFTQLPVLKFNDQIASQVIDITGEYNFNGLGGEAGCSTASDLTLWIKALLDGKVLRSVFQDMFTMVPINPRLSREKLQDYCGLGIYKTISPRYGEVIWSTGNNFGYSVLMSYSVKRDIAVIIAVNASYGRISLHSPGIVDAVLKQIL